MFIAPMLWISAAVSSPACRQEVSPLNDPISMTIRATSVPNILKALSAQGKLKLTNTAPFEKSILILQFKDAPLQDVMNQIGKILDGKWETSSDGFRLVKDPDAVKKEAQREHILIVNELKKSDTQRSGELNVPAAAGDAATTIPAKEDPSQEDDTISKTYKAYTVALTKALPYDEMANLAMENEIVYSTNANSLQRSLPGFAANVLPAYLNLARVEFDRTMQAIKERGEGESTPDLKYSATNFLDLVVQRPMKWLVTYRVTAPRVDGYFSPGFPQQQFSCDLRQISDPNTELPKPVHPEAKVNFSADSNTVKEFLSMFQSSVPPANIPSIRGIAGLQTPAVVDPLALLATDLYFAVGADMGKNLIALPDDAEFGPMIFSSSEFESLSSVGAVYEYFKTGAHVGSEVDGNWVRLSHPLRQVVDSHHVDRALLQQIIELDRRRAGVPLNTLLEFANTFPDAEQEFLMTVGMLVSPSCASIFSRSHDWEALRFFSSLPVGQRDAMLGGNTIPFNALPSGSKWQYVMLFDETGSGQFFFSPGFENDADLGVHFDTYTPAHVSDILGGPGGSAARLSSTFAKTIIVSLTGDDKFPLKLGPMRGAEYGVLKMSMTSDDSGAFEAIMPKLDPVFLGSRQEIKMLLTVNDHAFTIRTVFADTIGLEPVAYRDLPQSFRDEAEKPRGDQEIPPDRGR